LNSAHANRDESLYIYRFPLWALAVFAAVAALVYLGFARAIDFMVGQWSMDEFSHGYLIPFISLYLIWQRRNALQRLEFKGSWRGVAVVVAGLALDIVGRLASLYTIQHIALLLVIAGLVLSLAGWPAIKLLGAPLGVLIFMVPLPSVMLNTLSSELQLMSSSFGVWLIRLGGVPVLLEGNVIDLGNYKLEVAQACSGLRYLLPLMTLSFLMACFFRVALWKRVLLFLSSIPLTLVMNSLRIAAIGFMVDQWGSGMAEGLVHQVQGWMMFMLSTVVLMLEVALLAKVGGQRQSWHDVFGFAAIPPPPLNATRRKRALSVPVLVATGAILLFNGVALAMPTQTLQIPSRDSLTSFPLQFGQWSGQRQVMDQVYLNVLKLSDYLLADYLPASRSSGTLARSPVNLYVAWYDTQSTGDTTHSPKACLPGGGWRINDMRVVTLAGLTVNGQPLRVNRALIQYGDERQLVYYWFQQRGRVLTTELAVKWYLLVDALTRHRTDGALVRLVVPIGSATTVAAADLELKTFAAAAVPTLAGYIPN
jgi:exosortase D (VPLPA-CTERM-specific)